MVDFLEKVKSRFTLAFLGEDAGAGGLGKVLASETSLNILDTLSTGDDEIGVTASELSKKLGIARTTVIYHLGRLQETGLVTLNPALTQWDIFWDDYRKGRSGVSKEDFNRVHGAKMKGEKLYLPTGRGVLFLPTDEAAGEIILRETFASITAPSVEGPTDALKSAVATGILGIFFLAISFMFTPGMVPLPGVSVPMMSSEMASAPAEEMVAAPMAEMAEEAPTSKIERSKVQDMAHDKAQAEDEYASPPELSTDSNLAAVYEEPHLEKRPEGYVQSALKYVGVLFIGIALAMAVTFYRQDRAGKTI